MSKFSSGSGNGCLFIILGAFLCIPFIGMQTYCSLQDIRLYQNCTGHLKRAADASTVEMALSELTLATNYLEATAAQWARIAQVNENAIIKRLRRGWSHKQAVWVPIQRRTIQRKA